MGGCSRAFDRRSRDPAFAERYFVGVGLDIGGAPDPLSAQKSSFPRMGRVDVWDRPEGDAQYLAGVADAAYDFVHSSHCLEHLDDPFEGIRNWFRVLRPGGYLVVVVPDEDLYEQGQFPSTFNPDHRWTFTVSKARSWSSRSVNLVALLAALGGAADIRGLTVLDAGFRYDLPRADQTHRPGVESSIEFVVRKRPSDELAAGGPPSLVGSLGWREPEALFAQALAHHGAGRLVEAKALYRALIASRPDFPQPFNNLGAILLAEGKLAEAEHLFRLALALDPGHAKAAANLAVARARMGRTDD